MLISDGFMKKLSIIILLLSSFCAHGSTDEEELYKLVRSFHQLSTAYMLCRDETADHKTKPSLKEDYKKWFTASTASIFGEICENHVASIVSHDIRYGVGGIFEIDDGDAGAYDRKIMRGLNLHVKGKPKIKNDSAIVKFTYDFPEKPYKDFGNFVEYTLKHENGKWLIHDMATGGNSSREIDWGEDTKSIRTLITEKLEYAKKQEEKLSKNKRSTPLSAAP